MTGIAPSRRLPLTVWLLGAGILAVPLLLWGADSPVSRWTGLDFHYLVRPLTLCGSLLLLSRLVLWVSGTNLALRLAAGQLMPAGKGETANRRRLAAVLPLVPRLLADSGWTVLVLGLLATISRLPATISGHPVDPGLASLDPYFRIFDSLALWGVLFAVPFVIVRAIAEIRPVVGEIIKPPWSRLGILGAAYVLLADGGVFSLAFGLHGSRVLLGLGLVLGLSYGASILRNVANVTSPRRFLSMSQSRAVLLLTEGAWIAVLLGTVTALPSALEPALLDHYEADPESLAAYLEILHSLTFWAVVVLLPFAAARAAGVFWPIADRILGFPIARLVLLVIVYVTFSDRGVLSTAFEVDASQLMVVLSLALALSYAASVLRNIASIQIPGRSEALIARVPGLVVPLAVAAAPAMAVWVGLNHLPVASAVLLDHSVTKRFGETYLPHFGNLFDVRYTVAGLCFVAGLALSLPRTLEGRASLRYQPLVAAVSYSAVGSLTWAATSSLSALGHGYVLGGAVAAAGMFSLALTKLAGYATASSSRVLSDIANWLVASKVRGFVLGAAVSFYGLLLRPVLYETLWFAALYEYVALLVLMLLILIHVMNRLRLDANTLEAVQPVWTDWSHHQQILEIKADPRSELTSTLRQRFVDYGDWRPLWTYLMGLLYRSEASLDSMRAVCRPLRNRTIDSPVWRILGRSTRKRSKRMSALEESLNIVEQVLAFPTTPFQTIPEDALREAAGPFIESGDDPETLAITLIAAHCQRGDDLEQSVAQWFKLLDPPKLSSGWLNPPWVQSAARSRDRRRRFYLVDSAIAHLFGDTTSHVSARPIAWLEDQERSRP